MFEPTTILRPSAGTLYRVFEGEAVLLNVDSGSYYVLNETASAIWQLCDGERDLQAIVDRLCQEYDVEVDQAWASLNCFLPDLVHAKLAEYRV
jgi:hypothetical protein